MTRDDRRNACIEAMAMAAANSGCAFSVWDWLSDDTKEAHRREQAAAFDALPLAGARVVPVIWEGFPFRRKSELTYRKAVYEAMTADADLTNQPEMGTVKNVPRILVMFTTEGFYPIEAESNRPLDQIAADHGRLNSHVLRIENALGNTLWVRAPEKKP